MKKYLKNIKYHTIIRTFVLLIISSVANSINAQTVLPDIEPHESMNNKIGIYAKLDTLNSMQLDNYSINMAEGEISKHDSLNVEIGFGGFSGYSYREKTTNKLVMLKYGQTIHYNYHTKDSLKGNTERLEITIYYDKNEKPDLAKIIDSNYNDNESISSNLFYLDLPNSPDRLVDIFYSKPFLRDITKYIFELSEKEQSKRN